MGCDYMNEFYVLANSFGDRKTSSTDFLPSDFVAIGDAPKCPLCGKYIGMCPLVGKVAVDLEIWNDSADDVCFGPGDEVLFSLRLKNAFEFAQLKGTTFRTVEVGKVKSHKRGKPIIPPYYLTNISRSRAIVDATASGIEWDGNVDCEECHLDGIIKRFKKIVLLPGSWSGEDIFFARGLPGIIITSKKFHAISDSIGLPSDLMIPIGKFSVDYYPCTR